MIDRAMQEQVTELRNWARHVRKIALSLHDTAEAMIHLSCEIYDIGCGEHVGPKSRGGEPTDQAAELGLDAFLAGSFKNYGHKVKCSVCGRMIYSREHQGRRYPLFHADRDGLSTNCKGSTQPGIERKHKGKRR